MTEDQATEWRKKARGVAYKAGLRSADLDDAEVVGWTAGWRAWERAKADITVRDMDGFVHKSIVNAVKDHVRNTKKARSEVTNRDWGE